MFNTTRQFVAATALIAAMGFPMTAAAQVDAPQTAQTQPATTTYAWERSAETLETAELAIREAVDQQLAAQGLVEVQSGADLMASLETATWSEVQTHSHPPMMTRPRVSRRAFMRGIEVVEMREVDLGRFDVTLTDAATGDTVWQDGKEGTPRSKMTKNVAKIEKATAKMFKNFELDAPNAG